MKVRMFNNVNDNERVLGCFRRRNSPTQILFTSKDIFAVDFEETMKDITFKFAVLKPAEEINVHLGFLKNESVAQGLGAFGDNIAQKHNLTFNKPPKTGKAEKKISWNTYPVCCGFSNYCATYSCFAVGRMFEVK